ncbi:hypothetical protein Purlil1_6990 [Purpureocillium lilacinum]|uniref:Uncharacterized protein n=1 Tax=Purpureocillium lilacinum TaxID=33203 RepID=A0ABR0BXK7_PURLI|nr:hypothetical protein Purlil1_6990 [Purpureocillium lilacinum]
MNGETRRQICHDVQIRIGRLGMGQARVADDPDSSGSHLKPAKTAVHAPGTCFLRLKGSHKTVYSGRRALEVALPRPFLVLFFVCPARATTQVADVGVVVPPRVLGLGVREPWAPPPAAPLAVLPGSDEEPYVGRDAGSRVCSATGAPDVTTLDAEQPSSFVFTVVMSGAPPAQAPAPAPAAKALGPVAAHPMELTRRHCGHGIGPSLAAAAASSDGRAQWMQAQAGKVREGTYRTLQGCLTEVCEYLLHSTACPEPWDWIHARLPRGEEVLHRSSSLPRWSGEVPRSPTAQPSLEVQPASPPAQRLPCPPLRQVRSVLQCCVTIIPPRRSLSLSLSVSLSPSHHPPSSIASHRVHRRIHRDTASCQSAAQFGFEHSPGTPQLMSAAVAPADSCATPSRARLDAFAPPACAPAAEKKNTYTPDRPRPDSGDSSRHSLQPHQQHQFVWPCALDRALFQLRRQLLLTSAPLI